MTSTSQKPPSIAHVPTGEIAPAPAGEIASAPAGDDEVVSPSIPPDVATPSNAPDSALKKGAAALAAKIIGEQQASAVSSHAAAMLDDKPTVSTQSARVIEEIASQKPEMLVPQVDRICTALFSTNPRVVQASAAALPLLARLAPARVAKHLPTLTESFPKASEMGKDGLVKTFASLCAASVAYQKRLEPAIEVALSSADPKTLARWTEIVLPALKGEPHAQARAVVEQRLAGLPKPIAQGIADFLGIKLRVTR